MAGHETILVIDDDEDFCYLLQLALQEAEAGTVIELVHDGWAAIKQLRELCSGAVDHGCPDLILLDLRMPGLSGLEVLRWIRSQRRLADIPVVVFSGLESEREPAEAIAFGATSVRVKPFSYRELIRDARELCEGYLHTAGVKHAA